MLKLSATVQDVLLLLLVCLISTMLLVCAVDIKPDLSCRDQMNLKFTSPSPLFAKFINVAIDVPQAQPPFVLKYSSPFDALPPTSIWYADAAPVFSNLAERSDAFEPVA